jgi:hypothetical protein
MAPRRRPDLPKEVPTVASSETRRFEAAKDLSQLALGFLPWFVGALLLILTGVEYESFRSIDALHATTAAAIKAPSTSPDLQPIDLAITNLGAEPAARQVKGPDLAVLVRQIAQNPALEDDRRLALTACADQAAKPDADPQALKPCAATIQALRAKLTTGCGNCALHDLTELTKIEEDARSAFRAHWLQIAQLVLLNLMLPLLTGLFGFLFGRETAATQGAATEDRSDPGD